MERAVTSPKPWLPVLVWVVVAVGVGTLSGLATAASVDTWFTTVQQPWFAPPNWLFGPVWTVLYILMGVAAGLVWSKGTGDVHVRRALWLFCLQLLLNAAWSPIFFVLHRLEWALVEMILLWAAIIATMFAFARVRRTAAWLLLPYICWVSFALLLNAAYVRLN